MNHPGDTVYSLIQRADKALYHAKKSGKDRATVFSADLERV
jgi:PleD family two-component response regulator